MNRNKKDIKVNNALKGILAPILKWLTSVTSYFKICLCCVPIVIFSKQIGTYLEAQERYFPVKTTHYRSYNVCSIQQKKVTFLEISKCFLPSNYCVERKVI